MKGRIVGKSYKANNEHSTRFADLRKAEKARRKADKKANKQRKAA